MTKTIMWLLIAGWTLACGDAEPEPIGNTQQAFITRSSLTGARTWGVTTINGNRDSCIKTNASQTCNFVATHEGGAFDHEAPTQVFNVCIVPTFPVGEGSGTGGPTPFWEIVDTVETWRGNMYQIGLGSTVAAWSFSRTVPPNMGSVCNGPGTNVVIRPGVTTPPLTSAYGQYATAEFADCTTMSEVGTVNGTYKWCKSAVINFALNQLTSYTTAQGYTLNQRKQKRREAIMRALDTVVGIGGQTSNSNVVSFNTMSPPSKFLLSNEETCRLQHLAITGNIFGGSFMQIDSATCAD